MPGIPDTTFGAELYDSVSPLATADANNDYALLTLVDGIGSMAAQLELLTRTRNVLEDNLVINPVFKKDTAGWDYHFLNPPTSITRVNDPDVKGGYALEVVTPATVSTGATYHNNLMLTAGKLYYARVKFRKVSGTSGVFIDVVGASPVVTYRLATVATDAEWTEYELLFSPLNSGEHLLITQNNGASAITYRLADVLIAEGDPRHEEFRDPWSIIMDVDHTPAYALPYLAQFVGQTIPIGTNEFTARASIKTPSNQERGAIAKMTYEAQLTLTGTKYCRMVERADGNPWLIRVFTMTSETASSAVTLAAINAVKPAGMVIDLQVSATTTIDGLVGTIDGLGATTIDAL